MSWRGHRPMFRTKPGDWGFKVSTSYSSVYTPLYYLNMSSGEPALMKKEKKKLIHGRSLVLSGLANQQRWKDSTHTERETLIY